MATSTESSTKLCVACGKNVAGGKRMKDSDGRYWCVECGQADLAKRKQKSKAGAGSGGLCGGCGDQYPESKLMKYGAQKLCPTCIRAQTKGPGLMTTIKGVFSGGGGGGGSGDKKKLVMMIAGMVVLALIAWWVNKPQY